MHLDKRLLLLLAGTRVRLVLAVSFGLLGGVFTVAFAAQLSKIVGAAVYSREVSLPTALGWLVIWTGLRAGTTFLSEGLAIDIAGKIKVDLRDQLIAKIQRLGPVYLGRKASAELTTTAIQGVETLDAYFSQYLPQLILAVGLPAIILIWVFPLDLLTAIVFLVTAPIIPLFMLLIGRLSEVVTRRQWEALNRMSAQLLDTIRGLATLKALNQSMAQAERVRMVSEQYSSTTLSVLRVTFLSALVLELAATISVAVVAVQIGLRVLYGGLAFESAFFILVIAPEFYQPMRLLGARFHAGVSSVTAARDIFEVLALPEPSGNESKVEVCGSLELDAGDLNILFENVSFSYPGREEDAVRGITFKISKGEIVALVGESGSGKSTVANLLLGFAIADQGKILVNGKQLGAYSREEWWRQVGWVSQRPYLFHGTLEENIRLGKREATKEELRIAVAQAGLEEFIQRTPDGFKTSIGEAGVRLSAGEAQRVALARAFLKNPPVLILDEPTAHLDAELEAELEGVVHRLVAGRATLVIAHRLSTIQRADQVLVMSRGTIRERGQHEGLIARGGLYSQLIHGEEMA